MKKTCPICFREVSWNYFGLVEHAKIHATTIRDLHERDTAEKTNKAFEGETELISLGTTTTTITLPDDFARWHSQCELACRECGKVYRKVKLFKTHLLSEHRMKAGKTFIQCCCENPLL